MELLFVVWSRFVSGSSLLGSLFSSGSSLLSGGSYSAVSSGSCAVGSYSLLNYLSLLNGYYRVGVSCVVSSLVAARYHCYAEYNSESENDLLHFFFNFKIIKQFFLLSKTVQR